MEQTTGKMTLSRIGEVLQTIQETCTRFQLVSLTHQLKTAEALLLQNPPIDVAILGQFKAGKSSFINSLIGKTVLPVGAIPVTTSITRLQYGETEQAVVRHFDGSTTVISLPDIADFTSEARNPANEKNVEVVDIKLPSLEEYNGLRLVDTPGLGSVFKYHKATSENWLPEVGAALLAISADRPLSENDLSLIRELMRHTPNIILLLTKSDLLSSEQQREVTQFIKETLQRELKRELPIYLYSTRAETERHKLRVDAEILYRLAVNRDIELRRILQYKTHSLAKSCLSYLDIALQTALQADQDRESLRAQILDEKVNADLIREGLGMITREYQRQTRPMIQAPLDRFHSSVTAAVRSKLEQDMAAWTGNLWTLTRRHEAWMAETMTAEMRQISQAEHQHFFGTLKKAHASMSRSLEAFRKSLDENIRKVLGVQLVAVDWDIDVVEPERPDIIATRTFNIHLDLLWFLIPMFIFRGLFEKRFIRSVSRDAEMNLSRLGAQWEMQINNAIEAMKKQAITYVEEELATIEGLLSKTHDQTEDIRRLMAKIRISLD